MASHLLAYRHCKALSRIYTIAELNRRIRKSRRMHWRIEYSDMNYPDTKDVWVS